MTFRPESQCTVRLRLVGQLSLYYSISDGADVDDLEHGVNRTRELGLVVNQTCDSANSGLVGEEVERNAPVDLDAKLVVDNLLRITERVVENVLDSTDGSNANRLRLAFQIAVAVSLLVSLLNRNGQQYIFVSHFVLPSSLPYSSLRSL